MPANRLRDQKSPYLLQHADNPVDWYAWTDEAFQAAHDRDVPIFLSIGYSTCHWCHVMAHESFEDPDVAHLMNGAFVNIKVDREERPDIDHLYMTVCQILTQSGGWPLTIIMTPDKKPFFAATYIPRQSRYGRTGMLDLIPRIRQMWQTQRKQILESADQVIAALTAAEGETGRRGDKEQQQSPGIGTQRSGPSTQDLDLAWQQLSQNFDPVYGGFGTAPKFPTAHNLSFLLRYWKRTGHDQPLPMVEKTLQAIRRGGVYDQIGFGLHRYATDQEWLVPHFEKMLYDQALLTIACVETYQATSKPLYAQIARDTLTYVLRDMTDPNGGFYSAEDADSEGVEGKFYTWTEAEIRQLLPKRQADLFIDTYNIRPDGNYREDAPSEHSQPQPGRNIPYLSDPMQPQDHLIVTLSDPAAVAAVESARRTLLAAREKRIHPGKDDKILTDWNGLMIAALTKAAAALDEPMYASAARRAADFILRHLRTGEGRLLHRYRQAEASISATLDDYAFLVWGLIESYEGAFDARDLEVAIQLTDDAIRLFGDESAGGFFLTPADNRDVPVRQKPVYDGAVPSGNSVMMHNLLRLSRLTGRSQYEDMASGTYQAFASQVTQAPMAYTQMLTALDLAIGPSYEVVVAGPASAEATRQMLGALAQPFLPRKVVLLKPTDEDSPLVTKLAPFAASYTARDGDPLAYVCRDYQCQTPTASISQMLDLLE